MKRISVTTLEKFRRFMADTSSYDTEAALLETLEGKFTGNDKTKTGSAFHKLIEEPETGIIKQINGAMYVVSENIAFPKDEAQAAFDYRAAHPLMIHEVEVKKVYKTPFHDILVTGRMDGIVGKQVRDAKTKFRAPSDIADYTDSCQWRYYLDMLGLKEFFYDVFEVKKFNDLSNVVDGVSVLEGIKIVPHEPIPCFSYLNIHEECTYIVSQFMEYIEHRNLFHLLKPAENAQTTIL